MKAVSILIKPTGSGCNIKCEYCFYRCMRSDMEVSYVSEGIVMSDETLEKLIINAFEYAEEYVCFAFQGGEPTLAGIEFFKKAVKLQKKYNYNNIKVENTIQTNGILIDEKWSEFLSDNDFLVGLSVDGPPSLNDKYRKYTDGIGTFSEIIKTISLFDEMNVKYNIVSVVTSASISKAAYLYKFYSKHQFKYVQLIPCMEEKFKVDRGKNETPVLTDMKQYGRFLCEFFDLWYEDYKNGDFIDIRLFSNLIQIAAGYPAEECGMSGSCNCYFVVEKDGSVYPCDFYCTNEWQLGTVDNSFFDMYNSEKAKQFIKQSAVVHKDCPACKYYCICRGGCRRLRTDDAGTNGVGKYLFCEAYKIFFDHAIERINEISQILK